MIDFDAKVYYTVEGGNSYLTVYGWTKNPTVEYYIIENHGWYNPVTNFSPKGTLEVDDSIYDIGMTTRVLWTPIDGQGVIRTFYSVRRSLRTQGTVDVGAHFRAWKAANMTLGTSHEWQIMACEGYFTNGSCSVEVREVQT